MPVLPPAAIVRENNNHYPKINSQQQPKVSITTHVSLVYRKLLIDNSKLDLFTPYAYLKAGESLPPVSHTWKANYC